MNIIALLIVLLIAVTFTIVAKRVWQNPGYTTSKRFENLLKGVSGNNGPTTWANL